MRPARRHHFVSQFYLRHFSANHALGKIFVVDLERRKSFKTSTVNIALETDFHTVSASGKPTDAVEKQIAQLESVFARSLTRVIDRGYVGDDEDGHNLLYFVTLLFIKNPAMRSSVNEVAEELMKHKAQSDAADDTAWANLMQQLLDEGVFEANTDFEELRKFILGGKYKISLAAETHMDREFQGAGKFFEYMVNRRWDVYRAKSGHFVTSDRPVVLRAAGTDPYKKIGLGLRDTHIIFPLSSDVVIIGGFERRGKMTELSDRDVAIMNGHLIRKAWRQIYAKDEDFLYSLAPGRGFRRGKDMTTDDDLRRAD